MIILYLDESGDHDLINIDPEYPIFTLAGCIIESSHHECVLAPQLTKLKKDLFKTDKLVLHFLDYTRNKNGFEAMINKDFREKFYKRLNQVIKDTDFRLVACIIDKNKHRLHYKNAMDPYLLSLEIVLERFIMFLNSKGEQGMVIAESRGTQLDNQLNLAFLDLKIRGTRYLKPVEVINAIADFKIRKKEENIAGLQLVDTVISPIGRRYLNKTNYYLDYETIKEKFHKHSCGKYSGYGLVIFPRN
jgi:hypothetical protein